MRELAAVRQAPVRSREIDFVKVSPTQNMTLLVRSEHPAEEATALRLGESWSVPLIGVMVYEPRRNRLTPLVHIPSLDCMVWERSCGSGTGALGAYLALEERGPIAADVTQPGGTMRVTANCEHGRLTELTVAGSVRIVAEGKAYVHA